SPWVDSRGTSQMTSPAVGRSARARAAWTARVSRAVTSRRPPAATVVPVSWVIWLESFGEANRRPEAAATRRDDTAHPERQRSSFGAPFGWGRAPSSQESPQEDGARREGHRPGGQPACPRDVSHRGPGARAQGVVTALVEPDPEGSSRGGHGPARVRA